MSTQTDFERLTKAWLEDGPTVMSDRALQAALDEVHLTEPMALWRHPEDLPHEFQLL